MSLLELSDLSHAEFLIHNIFIKHKNKTSHMAKLCLLIAISYNTCTELTRAVLSVDPK